jgi:hypothetical protein
MGRGMGKLGMHVWVGICVPETAGRQGWQVSGSARPLGGGLDCRLQCAVVEWQHMHPLLQRQCTGMALIALKVSGCVM